jgi:hypothetical protein
VIGLISCCYGEKAFAAAAGAITYVTSWMEAEREKERNGRKGRRLGSINRELSTFFLSNNEVNTLN